MFCPRGFVIIFLILTQGALFADSGIPHPDPKNDSLIPISGWPFYLENIEIGSPVSDYGSHFGIKASVDNDGDNYPSFDTPNRIDAKHFLNMAHYSAITSFYGQVDQSYLWFKETSPGNIEHLKPASSRSIQFFPYGWSETASDPSISATGKILTIETDTFLFFITVKNITSGSITLTPYFTIFKDADPQREGTNVYGSSFGGCNSYDLDTANNIISLICNGTRQSKDINFVRSIKSSEKINSGNLSTGDNYKIDIELGSITLAQNEEKEITLIVSFSAEGDTLSDAKNLALSGWQRIQSAGGTAVIINSIAKEWDDFLNNLPVPHTSDLRYIQLYRMAATALRMNIYKKRNMMPADCSVPGKGHFNFFWAWDTPFHTLGQSEWDIKLAKDNLTTQFSGQGEKGNIMLVIDDNLTSNFWPDLTQPPVQGWAIKEIGERDKFADYNWLSSMYEASKKYLDYWEQNRDSDRDGLYEFSSGLETGWDDTPRFHCGTYTNICVAETDTIDSLDLNSWLYLYYNSMGKIARLLTIDNEAYDLTRKAEELAKNIDTKLWDEETGAFYDRELIVGNEHDFIRVLTPATFFPLFVGAVRNINKAKRVIEEHLLNPDEFWGTYPIPTVAYNNPRYDHTDDGYYWQGQIWLVTAYVALKALYRYGYEEEAEELKKRILNMMYNADTGGIHETYDALTGRIGWGAGSNGYFGGVEEPSVFQFGWSSAFTMEMLLDRYQRERFLMPDDKKISGFVKEITDIKDGQKYITIESDTYELPELILESASNSPIIESKSIYLKLEDPYNVFCTNGCPGTSSNMDKTFKVYLYFSSKVGEVKNDGTIDWINTENDSSGNYFAAKISGELTGVKYYLIIPQEEGCGCNTSNSNQSLSFFIISSILFLIILNRMAKKAEYWHNHRGHT